MQLNASMKAQRYIHGGFSDWLPDDESRDSLFDYWDVKTGWLPVVN